MWYFKSLLRHVFFRAPDHIDLWSGLVAAAITVIAHLLPQWGQVLTDLLWQIPLWVAVAVLGVRLLLAPYWIARDQRLKIRELEQELARLLDEYTHALSIEQIDHQERLQLNRQGTAPIRRDGCLLFRLNNTIPRPIEFVMRKIVVNGNELTNFSNRGAVISANSKTTFYTPTWPLDPGALNHQLDYRVECEIDYGQPRAMQRTRICVMRVEAFPKSQTTNFLYERNEDVAR